MKQMISIVMALTMILCTSATFAEGTAGTDDWILTQYYGGGANGMFYSIVNPTDSTLILIDGGWTANAEQVQTVIEQNGGKIDYWIVTHYHEDHCGAFNVLWPEYKDSVDTVYVTPLTWEEFEPYCNDWDTPDTFRLFLQQTEDAPNVVPLHRGDTFKIGNLKFEVFNAWDKEVLPITTDIANNCSLVFKVQSKKISFLFLGDVGVLAPYLLEKYGAEALYADYIQAGHHGWGVPMEVYDAIKPKEIFIDAADDLINSEDYRWKHGVLVKWCQDNDIPMRTYGGTPYSIRME